MCGSNRSVVFAGQRTLDILRVRQSPDGTNTVVLRPAYRNPRDSVAPSTTTVSATTADVSRTIVLVSLSMELAASHAVELPALVLQDPNELLGFYGRKPLAHEPTVTRARSAAGGSGSPWASSDSR
jgi:hypothetical protein